MNPESQPLTQVEDFLRRNRVALLTMFFSDIVGSTNLKQDLGDTVAVDLIQQHHSIVRELLAQFAGAEEIDTAGDSFFIVFAKPSDAVRFALRLQRALRTLSQKTGRIIQDRVGIHVGEIFVREEGSAERELFGLQIDTTARVMSLGEGDQILLSRFAFDNARQVLRGTTDDGFGELSWLNHGFYQMKGVEEPMEVCEVGEISQAVLRAPADTAKAHRFHAVGDEPVLGWRPAAGQVVPNTSWVLDAPLGEGGFGEVWLARHQQLKERRVFKFCFNAERARSLKREVTLFRVLRERIGSHPHIVGIEDVSFDQPPYYIVMEYVEGAALSKWDGVHTAPLASRLEVVAQIADALQAAHDAGVIHRDVKPSNIIVTEKKGDPCAMLTDFGIGQVISPQALAGVTMLGFTQTIITPGSNVGTQLYMAPELLAGEPATIRSDIYALGVIIYQLVLGDVHRPLTSDWSGQVEDPLLREDIRDCVAGDPSKRFAGAAQLAANLRRLPARHAELAEEKARLAAIARAAYRRGVMRTAVAALVIIGLVTGLAILSFIQYRHAKTNADRAAHARNEAEKLIEFMGVDLRKKLQPIGRLELLDSANQRVRAYYRSFADADKDLNILSRQSRALTNEGLILRDRGDQAGALKTFQEANALRERLAHEQPDNINFQADVATSTDLIGDVLKRQGNLPGALAAYQKSLDLRRAFAARFPSEKQWQRDLSTSWMNIGDGLINSGDLKGALEAYRQSLTIDEQQSRRDPSDSEWKHDLVTAHISLGAVLSQQNDMVGALKSYEEGLSIQQKLNELDPRNALWQRDLAVCLESIGDVFDVQGKHADALAKFEAALDVHRRLANQDPSNATWQGELFVSYAKVGDVLMNQGKAADALQRFRDGLGIQKAVSDQDPSNSASQRALSVAYERVGQALKAQNDLVAASNNFKESLAIRRRLVELDATNTESQRDVFVSLVQLADVLVLQHDAVEATKLYQQALRTEQELAARDATNVDWQRDLAEVQDKLAQVLEMQGNATEALPLYRLAASTYGKLNDQSASDFSARVSLASTSYRIGRLLASKKGADGEGEGREWLERARALITDLFQKREYLTKEDDDSITRLATAMKELSPK